MKGKLTISDGAEVLRDTVGRNVLQGDQKTLLNLTGVPYIDGGGLGELVRYSVITSKASGAVKATIARTLILDISYFCRHGFIAVDLRLAALLR